jgi:hypothetical protein
MVAWMSSTIPNDEEYKELPPLREECDAEDDAHALSVSRCSKEGSERGVLVDFFLHFQRM